MRLFVAVYPSDEAIEHLTRALPPLDGLRPVRPEHWHVTLVFCGDVDASTTTLFERQLSAVAAHEPAPQLRLRGSGSFGGALWVGVDGTLAPLQMAVAAAAREFGVHPEERPFHPHLTVARAPKGGRVDQAAQGLSSYSGPSWSCREIRLVHSRLGSPTRHVTLGAWPLGAG